MKSIIIIVLSVLISGCDSSSKLIFNELPNEGWPQDHWEAFTHKNYLLNDEVSLSWILRHDNEYPYANIFFIAELTTPKGETQFDTLNYKLAKADGIWLGSGMYLYELRLSYMERFLFEESGNYLFRLRPAVRPNDSIFADSILVGLHQIGLEIRTLSND
jgi:gliding motility-associated lipoprotein GldH|tara:strand:+ start:8828 stop:9307 length:480 start_codon:yes stop_codon:yes gene_type:complete